MKKVEMDGYLKTLSRVESLPKD
ncbi:MAG: hypothetical protein ACD_34C00334G0004, partial [uncultured bacterium]